jgi:hyperosmotically inducible periplasmic protein
MRTYRDLTTIVVAAGLVVSLLAGCAGKSVRKSVDDLTITARVKTALLNDPDITAPRIDVETANGVVTLSGRVASKQEEQKAIQVARSIGGVVDVRSTLQIQQ